MALMCSSCSQIYTKTSLCFRKAAEEKKLQEEAERKAAEEAERQRRLDAGEEVEEEPVPQEGVNSVLVRVIVGCCAPSLLTHYMVCLRPYNFACLPETQLLLPPCKPPCKAITRTPFLPMPKHVCCSSFY